jgi:hypothetical protein
VVDVTQDGHHRRAGCELGGVLFIQRAPPGRRLGLGRGRLRLFLVQARLEPQLLGDDGRRSKSIGWFMFAMTPLAINCLITSIGLT